MSRPIRRINLQLFAADGAGTGGTPPEGQLDNPQGDQHPTEPQTFDDVLKTNKTWQAEFDRRIAKSLETARVKWQQDMDKALEQTKTEAEKMARMTAEQRAEAERQKREQGLIEREREISKREMRAEALETLASKQLPATLVDLLDYSSAEACTASIEKMSTTWAAAIEAEVNRRLQGNPPKAGTPGQQDTLTPSLRKAMGLP